MAVYRLTGQDTIKISGRLMSDFSSGDVCKVTFATDIVTVKTGKNGNAIFAGNETGNQATVELRVLRGSDDDKFLNSLLSSYRNSPTRFILMSGELIKNMGTGKSASEGGQEAQVVADTYILSGGVFTKLVEGVSNVEGDIEQAVSLYTMMFAYAPRAIA
jgi:hypothetical protein